MRDPRRAYRVVDAFEEELADYCGAPFAVAVDSCTNALYACFVLQKWVSDDQHHLPGPWMPEGMTVDYAYRVNVPRRTYVGVAQAARTANLIIDWTDEDWIGRGYYMLTPRTIDAARRIGQGCFDLGLAQRSVKMCLSFHAAKQLPLGRGGAVLTDNHHIVEWLQRFRTDGRAPGDTGTYATFPAAHCYMPPDVAARGLWILSRWNDAGYSPPPLPHEDYHDLSLLEVAS